MIYTIIQVSRSFVLLMALGQECAPEVSSELPWGPVSNVKAIETPVGCQVSYTSYTAPQWAMRLVPKVQGFRGSRIFPSGYDNTVLYVGTMWQE